VERHFRDQRLNPIHEGTTGIQGLDLLGRKVRMADGAGLTLLLAAIRNELEAARAFPALAEEVARLGEMTELLPAVTRTLLQAQIDLGPDRALAEATAYLDAFGTIVVAWRWLAMACRAAAEPADDFYAGKLAACRFFYRYELRRAKASLEHLATLDDSIFAVRPEML
jgi:butyryl-CoA dehydrogenase